MTVSHPNQELARRLMPVAAYIREHDLGDGHLAEVALQGLAEYLGLDIVVVDPDPEQKLEDLGRDYMDVLGQLARAPDPDVRATVPDAAYGMVTKAMKVLTEMYEREADGSPSGLGR